MINSVSHRTSTTASSATTSTDFATPAPIYTKNDVEVYVDSVKKTVDSQYAVTIGTDNTANIRFTSGNVPADGVGVVIVRSLPYLQGQNFINNDALDIENVETGLDKITVMTQQLADGKDYSFKFAKELATAEFNSTSVVGTNFENVQDRATTLSATKTTRANKYVGFDANGDISVSGDIGIYRGDWVTGTAYVVKDLVKQNSDSDSTAALTKGNIYICITKHDSTGSYLTENDTANWTLVLDTVVATSGIEESKAWATKVDGIVDASTGSDDFSSKAYAIGGTGVDNVAGSAKDWATETGSTPSSTATDASAKEWAIGSSSHKSEYSAKEYAIGDETASGGSAKAWAIDESSPDGTSEKSAKTLAAEAAADVLLTHADVLLTNADVISTGEDVEATNADVVLTNADVVTTAASEVAAKASAAAVASSLDSFNDTYLGTMSDSSTQGTNPTTNGTWAKNSSAITVASGSNIKVGQVVTGTGMPSPPPNVISVVGTAVVVSENMAAAGSAVALTFTGYGVYGTYNGTKDGPTTDNDNGALADGMLYFNTTDNNMMVYKTTGASWIAATASGGVSLVIHKVTASGSETSFAAGTFTPTLSYEVNNIVVFLNGVRLDATDYTATTGTSITGLAAVAASDELVVLAFKTFEVADAVSAASGGTFNGAVTFSAGLTGDVTGNASGTAATVTGATQSAITTATNLTSVGTLTSATISGDLTVDTDTLKVDSTTNRVGIGTTPSYALDVKSLIGLHGSSSGTTKLATCAADSTENWLYIGSSQLHIRTQADSANRMTITDAGKVGIGCAPAVALEVIDTSNLETVAGFGADDDGTAFISVRTAETQNNLAGLTFSVGTATPTGVGSSASIGHVLGKVVNSGGPLHGELQFHTNYSDSITQKMVITDAGRVGIGDISPTYKLTVDGDGERLAFSAGASYPFMTGLRSNRSGTTCGNMYLETWRGDASNTPVTAIAIEGADGYVGIGDISPSYPLEVSHTTTGSYVANFEHGGGVSARHGIRIEAGADNGGSLTYYVAAKDGDGDDVGVLQNDGGTFSIADQSDERLKDNIADTKIHGLDNVMDMKVREFDWKKNGSHVPAGLIAQELKEIYPFAVTGEVGDKDPEDPTKDAYMFVSRDLLVPVLIKAVQELSTKVTALENA